jgi:hypothetical protein
MSSQFSVETITLIAVLGLYLIMFYKWLWKKIKESEAKKALRKSKQPEAQKKKQKQAEQQDSIVTQQNDDAEKLLKIIQDMKNNEKQNTPQGQLPE